MKKLKLKIQYFASTNKTTHYELSQYIANDKPTYLIDYNGDMLKIDNGIYAADARSLENASNIGTMTNLNTTDKSSLVAAINEVNTQVGTNTGNISTNTSNISTLGGNIGDLTNLTTTAKNNLVSAVNELKSVNDTQNTNISNNTSRIENFNLTTFDTLNVTSSSGTVHTSTDMRIAYNQDKSLAKIYGNIRINYSTADSLNTITMASDLRPESAIAINGYAKYIQDGTGAVVGLGETSLEIATDGTISLSNASLASSGTIVRYYFPPCLIFVKDFGDVPAQN